VLVIVISKTVQGALCYRKTVLLLRIRRRPFWQCAKVRGTKLVDTSLHKFIASKRSANRPSYCTGHGFWSSCRQSDLCLYRQDLKWQIVQHRPWPHNACLQTRIESDIDLSSVGESETAHPRLWTPAASAVDTACRSACRDRLNPHASEAKLQQ